VLALGGDLAREYLENDTSAYGKRGIERLRAASLAARRLAKGLDVFTGQ